MNIHSIQPMAFSRATLNRGQISESNRRVVGRPPLSGIRMKVHSFTVAMVPVLLTLVSLSACSAPRGHEPKLEMAGYVQPEAGSAAGSTIEVAPAAHHDGTTPVSYAVDPTMPRPGKEGGGSLSLKSMPKMLSRGLSLFNLLVKEPVLHPLSSTKRLVVLTTGAAGRMLTPSVMPGRPTEPLPQAGAGEGMDLEAWEKELDQITGTRQSRGTLEYLIDGEAYFNALEEAIDGAESSIDIRTYIFDNDDYAVAIADRLKARSGDVEVRVLLDGIGTMAAAGARSESLPSGHRGPHSIKRYLRKDSEVSVRTQPNPWLSGDHTKTTTIDGRTAFIGGMNIGREYRYDWHDLMMRIEGPVVQEVTRGFDKLWARSGFFRELGALAYVSKPKTAADEDAGYPMRILRTRVEDPDIYKSQLAAIRNARQYIYIENGYFTDNRILRELVKARRRGVDVRVVLPMNNDNKLLMASNVVTANVLFKNGIRVYFYPGMSHIKAAIYDGWANLGSANFDYLSLRVNKELNIATSHPPLVDALREQLFEVDFAKSEEMTAPLKERTFDRMAQMIANQL